MPKYVMIRHTSKVLLNSEIGVIGGLNIVLASIEVNCGGVGVFVSSAPRIDWKTPVENLTLEVSVFSWCPMDAFNLFSRLSFNGVLDSSSK